MTCVTFKSLETNFNNNWPCCGKKILFISENVIYRHRLYSAKVCVRHFKNNFQIGHIRLKSLFYVTGQSLLVSCCTIRGSQVLLHYLAQSEISLKVHSTFKNLLNLMSDEHLAMKSTNNTATCIESPFLKCTQGQKFKQTKV